jgi:DNA-binding CsgD family transcriptional regulator/PAS domain-containing protein
MLEISPAFIGRRGLVAFDFTAIGTAFAEAAVDPSRWDAAMDVAERATASAGALLFDARGHLPSVPYSRSMAPAFDIYVRDGWIDRDDRYRLMPFLIRRGVASDLDLFTPEDISKSPYYQEFLAPLGLRWYAAVKIAAGDHFWILSLQRTFEEGPFALGELAELAKLSYQLGATAAVAGALGFAKAEAALDAFSVSETAAVMVDRNGEVIRVNTSAERLMGRDLQVTHRHLASFDRSATDSLDRTLRMLLRAQREIASMPPVPLPRIGSRPLLAYPVRLPNVSYNALAPCQAVIILVDPEAGFRPPEVALRSCYGLSASEAKLARRLSSGERLETAALAMGLTYETVRNQLKLIFSKTGTHRQGELVALLGGTAMSRQPD